MKSKISYSNGYYRGEIKNSSPNGEGTFTFFNHSQCIGNWNADKNIGWGIFIFNENRKFLAEWEVFQTRNEILVITALPDDLLFHCQVGCKSAKNKHNKLELFSDLELESYSNSLLADASSIGCYKAKNILKNRSNSGDGEASGFLAEITGNNKLKEK